MISPPATAPIGESIPPTIIAGNATSAIAPIVGDSAAGPDASVTPASAARPAEIAHETMNTRRALMPWASAASASKAVARMATPSVERRKNRKKPPSTAAAIPSVHRSRTANTTSPARTVSTPHGSARLRLSKPQIAVIACSMMNSRPIVIMITANTGSPTILRSTVRSRPAPNDRRAQDREQDRERERQPGGVGERVREVGAERHQRALREVDDAGGAVDDHEPERHERVAGPEREPVEAQLQELRHRAPRSGARTAARARGA